MSGKEMKMMNNHKQGILFIILAGTAPAMLFEKV